MLGYYYWMMINPRKFLVQLVFIPVSLFAFFVTSCESSNKEAYTGTWEYTEKITSDEVVYNNTRTITLTKSDYEETYFIRRENSNTIVSIIGTRGDLSQSNSNLTFSLKELGTCDRDESEACTENVMWYGQGTDYYNDNIHYFQTTVTGKFEVNGNTLRLRRDLNNDGDLEDAGEDVTFEMI
jgi:hypothetical protein